MLKKLIPAGRQGALKMIKIINLKFLFILMIFPISGFASLNLKHRKISQPYSKEQIIVEKKKILAKEKQSRLILSNLYDINKNIKKIVQEKAELGRKKDLLEIQSARLTDQIKSLEAIVSKYKLIIASRLRNLYKLNEDGIVKLFRQSSNPALYEKNLKILSLLSEHDKQMTSEYLNGKKNLEIEKRKLTAKLDIIKQLTIDLSTKEQTLVSQQQEKQQLLEKAKKDQMFSAQKLQILKAKSAVLADSGVLDSLLTESILDHKGHLNPPVIAKTYEPFGLKQNNNYVLNNKGVFYFLTAGSNVTSVFSGTISFKGQIPGYGNTIIIDHGDHFYSVYCHLNQIFVHTGDNIKANQKIALSGLSEIENKEGLYFEIRHFSEPNNPAEWLKGS